MTDRAVGFGFTSARLNPERTLVNGHASDNVSVRDRGVQYGDGLFETLAIHEGVPRHWDRHLARLVRGCQRLLFPSPDGELLLSEVTQVCAQVQRGVLKLILTRGTGPRGYRVAERVTPTRILATYPWPQFPDGYYQDGVTARICSTRLGHNPVLAGIKHLNRLEQVLARNEWNDPEIAEGIMLDLEGRVIEGTMSNLFLVHGNALATPDLSACGIRGIMRELILERSEDLGISPHIRPIGLDEVYAAQEAFLCNTVIGIWPIRCLRNGREHTFRRPEVTRRLMDSIGLISNLR